MSFVVAVPETLAAASADVGSIGSAVTGERCGRIGDHDGRSCCRG
jgi:hypothetical protein